MIKDGKGGANTTASGHSFEDKVELTETLMAKGFMLETSFVGKSLRDVGGVRGLLFKKGDLYKFLRRERVDYRRLLSKKLLPDNVFINYGNKTAYVIEVKYQSNAGSVDEKLQTCDFKRRQYLKMFAPLGYRVEFAYVLNSWFQKPEYKDTMEYILGSGCRYFFKEIDVAFLGLDRTAPTVSG
jgi:hypothetical protein